MLKLIKHAVSKFSSIASEQAWTEEEKKKEYFSEIEFSETLKSQRLLK